MGVDQQRAPSPCRDLDSLAAAVDLPFFLLNHRSPFHLARLSFLAHRVHQTPQTTLSETQYLLPRLYYSVVTVAVV